MRGNTPKRIVKWAILGTGSIANDMVQCLKQLDSCEVVTVGSRSYDNAKWFQTKWNIPRSYDSYNGAAADEEVDVCYIATPMERHFQDCMAVIQLGKAVLCEKSMAPNHIIANEIIQSAKDANVLFVHGVWSRFFPAMQKVKNLVDSSAIGEIKSARASFCQSFRAGECSALLEVGIYCIQFLQWVLDDPNSFMKPIIRGAFEKMCVDGLYDEYVNATIEFPHGKVGTMECSLGYCSERSAAVYGTKGVIEIPYPFW